MGLLWKKMGRTRAEMMKNKIFYVPELNGFGWAASSVIFMELMHFPKFLEN